MATDLFGPLDKTAHGNEYIMVVTDRSTNMVRAHPMGRVHAIDCASVFLDYWIAAYGPPDSILSDGGPQFTARLWQQVCNLLSVESNVTTPPRPQTNGQTERFNRTMGRTLDHYVAEHPTTWDQLLGALTLAYNTQPHRSTGVAPKELVNPVGVASWSLKNVSPKATYPMSRQTGTAAEKREQTALLTRLVSLIPQVRRALRITQVQGQPRQEALALGLRRGRRRVRLQTRTRPERRQAGALGHGPLPCAQGRRTYRRGGYRQGAPARKHHAPGARAVWTTGRPGHS